MMDIKEVQLQSFKRSFIKKAASLEDSYAAGDAPQRSNQAK